MMDIYLLKSELPIYDSYLCQYLAIKGGSSGFFFGGGGGRRSIDYLVRIL